MGGIVGSVVGGLFGGSKGASNAAGSISSLPNISQNTNAWQGLMNNQVSNANYLQGLMPQIQSLFQSQYNNPYASGLQTGAGTAGTALGGVGQAGLSGSTALGGAGNQILLQIPQLLNQGFDPQQTLYNQSKQQALDQANTQAAQMGLTGPYAANLVNQATQNFNTNWQNEQLQRYISSVQGAGGAGQQGAGLLGQSLSQGGTGAGDIYSGAGLPYGAYQTIGQGQQGAFGNLFNNVGGISGAEQSTENQLMNYISQALGQQMQRYNAIQQSASQGAQGGSALGGDIGSLAMNAIPMIASMF